MQVFVLRGFLRQDFTDPFFINAGIASVAGEIAWIAAGLSGFQCARCSLYRLGVYFADREQAN
jgi:hypothetical protein